MNPNKSIPLSGRGSARVEYQHESVDEMIYEFMTEHEIPGLTLAIVQAPYIPRVVGYGLSDMEQQRLASTRTLWAIGPISQAYAAVAAIQLYEASTLDIHLTITEYLPSLPSSWSNITVMQLLQHSTGIADYRRQKGFDYSKSYTFSQLIGSVKDEPLAFESGTKVDQSATNFLILAEIIEKVSGMPYEEFIHKNQIQKLHLKHTCFGKDIPKLKQEHLDEQDINHKLFKQDNDYIDPAENAVGYDAALDRQALPQSYTLKGFADLWASAEDVSLWDIALAGSILIKEPENRDLIYKPTVLKTGEIVRAVAGWEFPYHKGLMDIKGTIPGFSSYLSRFTDASELVCVTLLANKAGVDFTNLARRVASAFGESMSSGTNDHMFYTYESIFSVDETIHRIENQLQKAGTPIFAKFDHGKNAEEVGLVMHPTQVIVFGSPQVGTHLMQADPGFCIELPLKIAVWEDENRSVWISFPRMRARALWFDKLDDNPIIPKMDILLASLTQKAANIYQF